MFRLVRWIMGLKKDATGKREFAFILFLFSVGMTFWIVPSLDEENRSNILKTWIYAALAFGALAFGAEVLVRMYFGKIDKEKQENQTEYQEEYYDDDFPKLPESLRRKKYDY